MLICPARQSASASLRFSFWRSHLLHLHKWKIWMLQPHVERLCEIVIDRDVLAIFLKRQIARRLVFELFDNILVFSSAAVLRYYLDILQLLEILGCRTMGALLLQSSDEIVDIPLAGKGAARCR